MPLVTDETFGEAIERLSKDKNLVVDLETTGTRPFNGDRLIGIAINGAGESFYFPFRHVEENLPLARMVDLRWLLSRPDRVYTGFHYKFDLEFLLMDGFPLQQNVEDVMIAAHLLNENEPTFTLKGLSDKYLGADSSKEQKILDEELRSRKLGKSDMGKLPASMVAPYAMQDVSLTRRLRDFYLPHLKNWSLDQIWREYNGYLLIVTLMEVYGMRLDIALVEQYMTEAITKAGEVAVQLKELAGYDINLNSSKQVQAFLNVESSAKDVLEILAEQGDERATLVRNYRDWAKVNGTYYQPFLEMVDSAGDLHANLSLIGTISGRLSCSKPNLQAIPRYSEVYKVKDVFVARPGRTFVSCDYSQIEMRFATHYAQEERMAALIKAGMDLHTATAEALDIPRNAAKRINFGIIYGIGAQSLSEQLRIPFEQAKEYLEKYHAHYPGFRRLLRRCEMTAENRGYIRMWTGRVRHYDQTTDPHKAMSNLIQGGVAELMRVTIMKLHQELAPLGVRLLHQIHDDIIFEVPDDILWDVIPRIREIMQDYSQFTIPIVTEVKYGKRWGKLTEKEEKQNE